MKLPPRLLRRALERAEAAQKQLEVGKLTALLRSFYHPGQERMFRSPAKRKATIKGRRAGATSGGCREFMARALETPNWRGTYVTTTRIEAKARAWRSDTQSGLVDIIEQFGVPVARKGVPAYSLAGVIVEVREGELALEFSNGARIDLFGADNEHALTKQRGNAKHVYWIDEAQDFRWLERFYRAVISAALVDFDGECWLSGTPGRDCAGMFYDITGGETVAIGWLVVALSAMDNPFFGATPAERWARTAGKALADNGWSEDDPDFQREWGPRWVKTDARFVYAANAVPDHELCYAPQRLGVDGFPDLVAALDDLPGRVGEAKGKREYFLAMGADLGTRDAFAFVIWAWSLRDPNLYELCSWKRAGLDYDEMAAHLNAAMRQAYCGIVVADAGGGGKPAVMGWSKKWVARYNLPIIEATKTNKAMAIKQENNDIRHRRIKLRAGSPLLVEWRSHRWAPKRTSTGAMVEDVTENHCADAGLYAHRESYHHRFREEAPRTVPGTPEWIAREERELEDLNCATSEDLLSW